MHLFVSKAPPSGTFVYQKYIIVCVSLRSTILLKTVFWLLS